MDFGMNCPTEAQEQTVFVQWCQLNHIIVHHSPNEGGGGRAAAIRGAKMKKLGTSKGFWDLEVFIPIVWRLPIIGVLLGQFIV